LQDGGEEQGSAGGQRTTSTTEQTQSGQSTPQPVTQQPVTVTPTTVQSAERGRSTNENVKEDKSQTESSKKRE
jgi:hypothetical protein